MFNNIKKTLANFFLEEEGECSKKGILAMGLLSFAISSTAAKAANWVHFEDTGNGKDDAYYNADCIGIDDAGRFTVPIKNTMSESDEGTRTFEMSISRELIANSGLFSDIKPPEEGYTPINPAEDAVIIKVVDHLSGGPCCHVSNHFNSTRDETGDVILNITRVFYHQNSLNLAGAENTLTAQHLHNIASQPSDSSTKFAHVSDHWNGNKDCTSHDSNQLISTDNWVGDCKD
jgi:hypothetical protein